MKKHQISFFTLLFLACLLIFACRKEINSYIANEPKVELKLLEDSKKLNALITAYDAPYNQKIKDFIRLKPSWNEAYTRRHIDGTDLIVVPTTENDISNKAISMRRLYVFEVLEGEISYGRIYEFIGINYPIDKNIDQLLTNLRNPVIEGFNGAIIQYDLNYRRINGSVYENGKRSLEDVSLRSLTEKSDSPQHKSLYLKRATKSIAGKNVESKLQYLYTINTPGVSDKALIESNDDSNKNSSNNNVYGGNPPVNSTDATEQTTGDGPVVETNTAYLCGGVYPSLIGYSYTGGNMNLGFTAYITPQGGQTITVVVVFGVACWSIPESSVWYSSVAAGTMFMKSYNDALYEMIQLLKSRASIPMQGLLLSEFKGLIAAHLKSNANTYFTTFSSGPCLGIPHFAPKYC